MQQLYRPMRFDADGSSVARGGVTLATLSHATGYLTHPPWLRYPSTSAIKNLVKPGNKAPTPCVQ
jgi:hypothetical protein